MTLRATVREAPMKRKKKVKNKTIAIEDSFRTLLTSQVDDLLKGMDTDQKVQVVEQVFDLFASSMLATLRAAIVSTVASPFDDEDEEDEEGDEEDEDEDEEYEEGEYEEEE